MIVTTLNKTKKADEYIAENRDKVNARYRNLYHVMPPVGWMNDPNGFNFAMGQYHLFYQFHPYSAEWGPMHWGHFVSKDLIDWRELPVAIAPDEPYDKDGCFSGSSVEKDGKLYLMYTSVSGDMQTQSLAETSNGVDFKKLGQVITSDMLPAFVKKTDFRDPKIFKKNGKYYCFAGATDTDGKGIILSYVSPDLKVWKYLGVVLRDKRTNVCECPDYFESDGKEVLLYCPQFLPASGGKFQNQHSNVYVLGSFSADTGEFIKKYEGEIDSGFDFYAAQTLKTPDGRRVMIAWMAMWDRTPVTLKDGWSGAMTIPRELSVVDGKLYQRPVREIENYRTLHYHIEDKKAAEAKIPVFSATQEIIVTFSLGSAKKVGLKLFCREGRETLIYYDVETSRIVFDRTRMGEEVTGGENERDACVRYGDVKLFKNAFTMRIFTDVSSMEVFLGDGGCVMTANIYTGGSENGNIYAFSEGGEAKIKRLDVFNLEINKNKNRRKTQ